MVQRWAGSHDLPRSDRTLGPQVPVLTTVTLAAYTANPSLQHTTALKCILRYLSGTRTYGIVYRSLPHQSNFFYGYADAAYGNADEHRSTTGYVFIAGEGAITWSSRKQIATALSSTEAEYVALSEASREAFWLRNVYDELGLLQEDTPTEIRGDNEGSITMVRVAAVRFRTSVRT